jgi:branched-chain amino acid transport system ATP-binding protein
MSVLLKIDNLQAWYGKSHILHGVNLSIQEGELIALLGRNGAGKSTTMRAVMGLNPQTTGAITFQDRSLVGMKPHEITRAGLSLVPENRGIFGTLTVRENLKLAETSGSPWALEAVLDMFPALSDRLRTPGGKLSGGEQQMLSIGRALLAGPRLLLLDEPTEGLAPVIVERVVELLASLRRQGLTMLLVEQNLEVCKRIADRFAIIDQGVIVWTGDREALDGADDLIGSHLTLEHA